VAGARAALGDGAAATFSDDELLGYLNEALKEYSVHLPRLGEALITCVPGQRRYALPDDTTGVWRVTAVVNGAPVRALTYIKESRALFARRAYAYDFQPGEDASAPPRLVTSFDPTDGMQLDVLLRRPHAAVNGPNDYLTVPPAHHHVLVAYVLYAAARRLQSAEQSAPTSSSSLLMSQLAANTRRLELAYLQALNRILTHRLGEGEMVVWG
jgi:hypothetical protein